MNDKDYLLKGSVVKALVIFAIPFLLAVLLQALYGAVDLWVVGKFATSAEVSAVATGSQAMNVITQAHNRLHSPYRPVFRSEAS